MKTASKNFITQAQPIPIPLVSPEATDRANYRLSVSDMRNNGIYPTSKLDRQTINLRVGFNATKKLIR